jgi:hypothetical protein
VAGLMVRGTVLGRKRRLVGDDNKEVVTYVIGPERLVEVEQWTPEKYLPVGENVEFPVVARVYQGRVQFSMAEKEEVF